MPFLPYRTELDIALGVSRSSVPAGLIGGKIGDKGGLGVSVKIDGTTLLFINAHLAAHEGKFQQRLDDLVKIKVSCQLTRIFGCVRSCSLRMN